MLHHLTDLEVMLTIKRLFLALCITLSISIPIGETRTCHNSKRPLPAPEDLNPKPCYINCNTPLCKAKCKSETFYDQHDDDDDDDDHFSLMSDVNFQINARFASRDYSQIQALGVFFNHNTLTIEVTRAAKCDEAVEQYLKFSYNGDEVIVPEGYLSRWESSDSEIIFERISSEANRLLITVSDFVEISVRIVHVPKEDYMKVQNDQIPNDICCGHIEAGFKFYGLSSNAEGVLGRTYQKGFRTNPTKQGTGVAMQLNGGEEEYRTASLLSSECSLCRYSPAEDGCGRNDVFSIMEQGSWNKDLIDLSANLKIYKFQK